MLEFKHPCLMDNNMVLRLLHKVTWPMPSYLSSTSPIVPPSETEILRGNILPNRRISTQCGLRHSRPPCRPARHTFAATIPSRAITRSPV